MTKETALATLETARVEPARRARKTLLIVTPHFPPVDTPDMHRVRMNAHRYREHGWEPLVLTVNAASTGRLVDQSLTETLANDLEVHHGGALPAVITRPFGISDIAMRSYLHLRAAGDALISERRPDLILFSTTAFLAMSLGPHWLRRHGAPFVLDLQDPWHTTPNDDPFRRTGLKHAMMRRLHRVAEQRTAPLASGLISVSEHYIDALRGVYPALRNTPAATIPFGYADEDFEVAKHARSAWKPFAPSESALTCMYAGRISPAMTPSLESFVGLLAAAQQQGAEPLANMRAALLGTGYQADNPRVSDAAVERFGMRTRVVEHPNRLPFLDTLSTLESADVLLVLGSDDAAYQPSKLYQYLSLPKPVICVAPAGSRLAAIVAPLSSVVFVPTGADGASVRAASEKLSAILHAGTDAYADRRPLLEQFNARTLAARECELFDQALAHARAQ